MDGKLKKPLSLYGNELKAGDAKKIVKRQKWMKKKFGYNPDESYDLRLKDNPHLGPIFGVKDVIRSNEGEELEKDKGVIISTIRMGFGHYRIAMSAASCAKAMGFTPYWLDLLAIPGVPTRIINWCNTNYSMFSRISQRNNFFNKYIWESVTTGDKTIPGIWGFLNTWIEGWPWRFLKTSLKDYKMSELLGNLHYGLPKDMPVITSHMWNSMGAVAGGMTKVVDMMFDNWPMAFQLTEGAVHAVQTQSGYFGFRTMRGFDQKGRILKPVPQEAIKFTGHHVDHELVHNIEKDCGARITRMRNNEPRRFLLTMGGAGAQRELFKEIIDHCLPLIKQEKLTLFVNLGDHKDNWDWLEGTLGNNKEMVTTHFSWEDTKVYADGIREGTAKGLHVLLFDNTYHAVYATNYLMRVSDVLITKPSELAFYPIPKIFNERVGGHEKWGAIRSAEVGDGTLETRTIPETLQAIDLMVQEDDLLEMYCDSIVKNKSIGLYDGAYKSVELATGKKFDRNQLG